MTNDLERLAPDHAPNPATWIVVNGQATVVIVHAMCLCGDPNCGWTASPYADTFVSSR